MKIEDSLWRTGDHQGIVYMRNLYASAIRMIGLGLCMSVGLSALGGCGLKKAPDKPKGGPVEVGFVVVTPTEVVLKSEIAGRTSAFLVSDVRPQTTGIITRRLFTEGQMVKAGQSLYQIDPAQAQASLSAAKAALSQAEATQAAASLKASRYGELIKIKAISQQDYDDSQTSLKQATAAVEAQKAQLEAASLGVRYTQVRAPISGRVSLSTVTPGALVTANQTTPLTTVQDVSTIYVDMTQSAAEILRLRRALMKGDLKAGGPSAEVTLRLDDGTTYPQKGKLEFADAAVDEGTGTVRLRALFPNPDGLLLPGLYVQARLTKGVVDQGLLVPQTAVSRNPRGAATVYVAGDDGKAHLTVITVTEMVGNQWLVTDGLQAGDKVIVEGMMRLRPDAKIKASPAKLGSKASESGSEKTPGQTPTHSLATPSGPSLEKPTKKADSNAAVSLKPTVSLSMADLAPKASTLEKAASPVAKPDTTVAEPATRHEPPPVAVSTSTAPVISPPLSSN